MDTPIIVSEIPPSRQSSAISFVTRIRDRASSGVSTASVNTSSNYSSTSLSSAAQDQSRQQQNFENISNEHLDATIDALDTASYDSPPWASSHKPNSCWYNSRKSFGIYEEAEEQQFGKNEDIFSIPSNLDDNEEEREKSNDLNPLFMNDYSVVAKDFIYLPDEEEDITAEYKTAPTTFLSLGMAHNETDEYYEDDIKQLCRPHAAPCSKRLIRTDSQDTISYMEDGINDQDTQPYNAEEGGEETQSYYEDTQPYNSEEGREETQSYNEDTQPYNEDTQPYNAEEKEETQSYNEEIPNCDFSLMLDIPDDSDSDFVSPLASTDNDDGSVAFDSLPPSPSVLDQGEEIQEEELTEDDILQLKQEVEAKTNTTRKGKRRATSPIPVALESQIVRLDKKHIRTSAVKKPITIDDYFLHPTTMNDETEQDIGKVSKTPSFTISSNEDMNKPQVDTRRRPRFGLSKKRHY